MATAQAATDVRMESASMEQLVRRGALDFDLLAAAQLVIEQLGASDSKTAAQVRARLVAARQQQHALRDDADLKKALLDTLSDALLLPQLTCDIAALLRPVLIDLAARWIPSQDSSAASSSPLSWSDKRTQSILHAFARLLYAFEDVYDCLYAFLSHPALHGKHMLDGASDEQTAQALLVSVWRILYASPSLVYYLQFPLPPERLPPIWEATDQFTPATRLLTIKVFAQLVCLPPATRADYERKWIGEPSFSDHLVLEMRQNKRTSAALAASTGQAQSAMEVDGGVDDARRSGVEAYVPILEEGALVEELDVWILPILEFERFKHARSLFATHIPPFVASEGEKQLCTADLHASIVEMAGTLLVRHSAADPTSSQHATSSDFVETASAQSTLLTLAKLALRRRPMLLTGAPACGKTSLINHFCNTIAADGADRTILTIQLGDQSGIDAKQLLGSFISSPTNPGAFEWREGALTRAVRLGMWVVLEDIDRATTDVLQVIGQLVEGLTDTRDIGRRPMLDLGNRGKVRAGKNFQLFATRSVAPIIKGRGSTAKTTYAQATFLGANHWAEISMSAPDERDIGDIVQAYSPILASTGVSAKMVATWKRVQAFGSQAEAASSGAASAAATPAAGSRRTITLRDLLKWCQRAEAYLRDTATQAGDILAHTPHRERILIEACDVFLSSIPAPSLTTGASAPAKGKAVDRYSALFFILANSLDLTTEQAWSALRDRIPDFAIQTASSGSKTIRLGRAQIARADVSASQAADSELGALMGATVPVSGTFAMTKTSLMMLEQIAMATSQAEPILLVGETGTGKTTLVQHLASLLQRPLVALNLSQQTENGDLLGGFKPLDPKIPASEVHNRWSVLFQRTFSAKRNAVFIDAERKAFMSAKWKRLIGLWRESARMAAGRMRRGATKSLPEDSAAEAPSESRKRRRIDKGKADVEDDGGARQRELDSELDEEWKLFEGEIDSFEAQHASKRKNFVFSFVEGPLVHALRHGHWILLDEINLAASEVLQCLSGLLQSPTSSVTLTDRGDTVPVVRHPDFRLFACMNPATDVGKKDLAMGLRQRFTELYIPSPDTDIDALTSIVDKYIGQLAVGDRGAVMDAAEAYASIQRLSRAHELADGANQRPHYSVRTLSRALRFASDTARVFGLRRALYEGFVMAFSMLLESASLTKLMDVLQKHIIARAKNPRQVASLVPAMPTVAGKEYIQVGAFWLESGSSLPENVDNYVLTPSVQNKLIGLARAVMTRKYPVLIQGPTSAGKTSAIEYLAKRTGHAFVRINNHEHTDVQEYLGTYATDPKTGQLVFREGLLVNALKHGHWIVLDELNLAPTDVLEALNRLLDDNRELIIPETGEIIRPHPHFMLFATQNPPGLYAGRKVLSRAFRNRFLEIHFDDVPQPELQTILADRCGIAPSYAAKMVVIFVELQKRRQTGRVFETKQAFVTLRDLFRWGQREAVGYQALAENGYMLIAERARRPDDKAIVKEVLEEVMNVSINVDKLYDIASKSARARLGADLSKRLLASASSSQVVWTTAMTRLLYLISAAFRHNEPVLLVGETGTGKTSVCEAISVACNKALHTVNCHQNTDSADLLGGQRPLRNRSARRGAAEAQARAVLLELLEEDRLSDLASASSEDLLAELNSQLGQWSPEKETRSTKMAIVEARNQLSESMALFEWNDGPLVEAMRSGDHVLLDEISLADDSVLERLNSVLESGRSLVLTDGFVADGQDKNDGVGTALLVAADGFQIAATMNPGGDYGKKELSPALRNRFTEIWVPHVDGREDLLKIIGSRWKSQLLNAWSERILDFASWINAELGGHPTMGIRDMIAWVVFMNNTCGLADGVLSPEEAFVHGALLTVVDGLGTIPATAHMSRSNVAALRHRCLQRLATAVPAAVVELCARLTSAVKDGDQVARFDAFPLAKRSGSAADTNLFSLTAESPALNAMRVVRALHVPQKAILLEGSPGAGKTSLITALARVSRTPLARINLSDQTELMDLFGSDLPVEGGGPGEFAWKDAAFLRAMVQGEWVLLDEMNLASQSVLEGLNSCLDHRGTVYVPELGRSFDKHPDFRIFAAQNPIGQGGGRKGLPQSFLNRFTKVYVQEMTDSDMLKICQDIFDFVDPNLISDMIRFNARLQEATMLKNAFGRNGAPWEFNLRDVLRWMVLLPRLAKDDQRKVAIKRTRSMYLDRFRTVADQQAAWRLFEQVFGAQHSFPETPVPFFSSSHLQIGSTTLPTLRHLRAETTGPPRALLQAHLPALDTLCESVKHGRLSIVIGPAGSGKTSCVQTLAAAAGVALEEIRMSPGMDTSDLLGSFEQEDPTVDLKRATQAQVARITEKIAATDATASSLTGLLTLQRLFADFSHLDRETLFDTSTLEQAASQLKLDAEEHREITAFIDLVRRLSEDRSKGARRFRWVDGPFLRALKDGRWLLLDDANLCPASVLDRFNSLFEDRGSLVLSERGMVEGEVPVVHPHPKFRAFMTIDPRYGELSRAMRNRGIEICLPGHPTSPADTRRLSISRRFDPTFDLLGESLDKSVTEDYPWASLAASRIYNEDPDLYAPALSQWDCERIEDTAELAMRVDARAVQLLSNFDLGPRLTAHALTKQHITSHGKLAQEVVNHDRLNMLRHLQQFKPDALHSTESTDLLLYALLYDARLARVAAAAEPDDSSTISVLTRSVLLVGSDEADLSPEQVLFPLLQALLALLQSLTDHTDLVGLPLSSATDILDLAALVIQESAGSHVDYSLLHIAQKRLQESLLALRQLLLNGDATPFSAAEYLVAQLASKVKLTRGILMPAIWQMRVGGQLAQNVDRARGELLQALSVSQPFRRNEATKTAVDLAATLSCTRAEDSSDSLRDLLMLAARTSQMLTASPSVSTEDDDSPFEKFARHTESFKYALCSLLVESSTAHLRQSHSKIFVETLHHLVDIYCHSAANLPECAADMRAVGWKSDSTGFAIGEVTMSSIWDKLKFASSLETEDTSVGVAHIFRPIFLQSALVTGDTSAITLKDFAKVKALKQRSASMLSLALTTQAQTVTERLSFAIGDLVGLLTQSVRAVVSECGTEAIQAIAMGVGQSIPDVAALDVRLQALWQSGSAFASTTTEHSAMEQWLSCLQQVCVVLRNPSNSTLCEVGVALIKTAQAYFHLYWPNVPIDPLAPTKIHHGYLSIRRKRLSARLEASQLFERETTGDEDIASHRRLRKQISDVDGEREAMVTPTLDRGSSLGELEQLHREVLAFLKQVLNPDHIERLIETLQRGFSGAAEAQTSTMRSSIANFRSRLVKIGPSVKDVWSPLVTMFDTLTTGLAALVEGARQGGASKAARLALKVTQASTAFPTVLSAAQLQVLVGSNRQSLAKLGAPVFLLGLHSVLKLPLKVRKARQQLEVVDAVYSQMFDVWAAERKQQQKEAAEATSIYKSRKEDVVAPSEEEVEEQEFQALFPDYGDGLADQSAAATQLGESNGMAGNSVISAEERVELLQLHFALSGSGQQPDSAKRKEKVVKTLLEKHYEVLPQRLDLSSALYQMSAHALWMADIGSSSTAKEFYREPNPAEVQKAVLVVADLRDFLAKLLQDWPDQLVLQHIQDRCDAILSLRVDLPVARIMSALEMLLAHTDDWESYANSKTSLGEHREKITALIIAWRRLELNSWPALLTYAEQQQADLVSDWWFSFYETAALGTYDAAQKGTDALEAHIRDVVKLVDSFMRSSTLGQFSRRLELLGSFARFFNLRSEGVHSHVHVRLATILGNLHAFFEQASPAVLGALEQQRKGLERDITTFAKLASWKDVNIHALKQSAQKSHRRLHKTIRKFRAILRQPVDPILAANATPNSERLPAKSSLAASGEEQLLELPTQVFADWTEGKSHLVNLERTLQVLRQMRRDQLKNTLDGSCVEGLQAVGTEIIQRTQQLSKATPAKLTEENAKLLKQLTVRKQRAWTDLLKEQRRLGLSAYQNSQKSSTLTDPVAIFSIQSPDGKGLPGHTRDFLERAEQYHWRLLTSLPRSHDALQQRSEDVPVSDLLKGIHYVEHGVILALKERTRIATLVGNLHGIDEILRALGRLDDSTDGRARLVSEGAKAAYNKIELFLAQSIQVLKEVQTEAPGHLAASPFKQHGSAGFSELVTQQIATVEAIQSNFAVLIRSVEASSPAVLQQQDEMIVKQVSQRIEPVCEQLESVAAKSPALSSLCAASAQWLRTSLQTATRSVTGADRNGRHHAGEALSVSSNRIIDSVLLITQKLRSLPESDKVGHNAEDDSFGLPDAAILAQLRSLRAIDAQLRVGEVADQINTLLRNCAHNTETGSEGVTFALRRVAPFVAVYTQMVKAHLHTSCQWYAELLKYLYIVNQTVQSVITQGFCKPKEEQETSESNEADNQAEAGTGLADGSGANDITDQLDDDEEIEEMQRDDDQQEQDSGETEKQKGAKESGLDLDGPTEEKEADEEDPERSQEDEEEEEESEEPEDAIDKVDPFDPNAVDEKMWDGAKDEDKDDGGDVQDDRPPGADGDMSAPKDDNAQQPPESKGKEQPDTAEQGEDAHDQDQDQPPPEDGDAEEDQAGSEAEDEEQADAAMKEAPKIEDIQDGEVLDDIAEMPDHGDDDGYDDQDMGDADELEDLPDLQPEDAEAKQDDMDFDEEDPKGDDILDADDGNQAEDNEDAAEDEGKDDAVPEGEDDRHKDANDDAGSDGENEDQDAEEQPADTPVDQKQPAPSENAASGGPEPQAVNDFQPQTSVFDTNTDADPSSQLDKSSAAATGQQTSGVASSEQQAGAKPDQMDSSQDPNPEPQQQQQQQQESGAANESGRPMPNQSNVGADEQTSLEDDQRPTNPIRSLGDALQEFRRRLDHIQKATSEDVPDETLSEENKKEDGQAFPESGEIEHVAHDQHADAQALGAAEDSEVQRLDEAALLDESKQHDRAAPAIEEEAVALESALDEIMPDRPQETDRKHKGALMSSEVQTDRRASEFDDDNDARMTIAAEDKADLPDRVDQEEEEEAAENPTLTEPERAEADAALERELALLQAGPEEARLSRAAELWTSYTGLTADLSLSLCEQLRLILAPTLASRLNGDFRTGKRLNMRKIIPFIASDFAKDKIWLRRTKPSAREYQVLLAVDDSRSMAETRSAHLAYQTLALVTGALARLEVGDVSVCRFGADVEVLHPFGKGAIGASDGAQMLGKLSFGQRSTDVGRLVERSLGILGEARERGASQSSTAAELWQLQIIVSDGVCQDHAKLRTLLRRTSEQRIMLVFVVVDALHQPTTTTTGSTTTTQQQQQPASSTAGEPPPTRNSILTMQQVSYALDAQGKLDMKLERYLDTFPFEYYVVVRDVEALPDVLAETLRQWAEKIREGS
ncbi:hypothetical protein V8E36_004415 [Tilletia maclaganii]